LKRCLYLKTDVRLWKLITESQPIAAVYAVFCERGNSYTLLLQRWNSQLNMPIGRVQSLS